jgi:chromosome segregation ATPase
MALTVEDKAWLAERLDAINGRLDSGDARLAAINDRLDATDARLAAINDRLDSGDARLAAINDRLDATDARLAAINDRLDATNVRLDAMTDRADATDARLAAINDRLDATDARLDVTNARLSAADEHLTRYILDMRSEVIRRFDTVDQRLDFMANALLNVQPLNKAMVELGALMGSMTRSQQQATDRHFDLENRVARLEEQMAKLNPAA